MISGALAIRAYALVCNRRMMGKACLATGRVKPAVYS